MVHRKSHEWVYKISRALKRLNAHQKDVKLKSKVESLSLLKLNKATQWSECYAAVVKKYQINTISKC